MASLALSQSFPIPGEQGFPLNAMYKPPANKTEEGYIDDYGRAPDFSVY